MESALTDGIVEAIVPLIIITTISRSRLVEGHFSPVEVFVMTLRLSFLSSSLRSFSLAHHSSSAFATCMNGAAR